MIKAIVSFYDGTEAKMVTIGTGEDIKAPRGLAVLEKDGWPIDEDLRLAYKAWLGLKRQGDIPADSKFESWVDNVEAIDLRATEKQIEQAVLLGEMSRDQADKLLALYEADMGEAQGPHA